MRPAAAIPCLAILASLLAACAGGGGGGPTVVLYEDKAGAPAAESAPQAEVSPVPKPVGKPEPREAGGYRVRKGDNLYLIARRFGVPIRTLIEANRLTPPYRLAEGQRLVVPQADTHVVQRGETLYSIARMHRVDRHEIVRLNHLGPPYTITPGQTLYLPAAANGDVQVAARTPAPAVNATPSAPAPAAEAAKAPERPVKQITVQPLPAPSAPAPTAAKPRPAASKPAPQPAKAQAAPAKPRAQPAPAAPQAAPAAPQVARAVGPRPPRRPASHTSTVIPKPPARDGKFLWPVRGRVISGFGPKAKGLHNDGINIAAPRGTPIKAAENGVVAYSGNELRGFGNLVLIRHADGYMTAYGHTAELLVKRGQTVRRGQTIARVGTSGAVSSPQLHFEIRKKKRALDPRRYLGG